MASQGAREDEIAPDWKIGVFLGIAALTVAWSPFWGIENIPFTPSGAAWTTTRPFASCGRCASRVLLAFLAGTGLATGGMAFQAMFRNPLATPFTLGVSSGAALGAAVCILQNWTFTLLGIPCVSLLAFLGAAVSIMLVYAMTRAADRGCLRPRCFWRAWP